MSIDLKEVVRLINERLEEKITSKFTSLLDLKAVEDECGILVKGRLGKRTIGWPIPISPEIESKAIEYADQIAEEALKMITTERYVAVISEGRDLSHLKYDIISNLLVKRNGDKWEMATPSDWGD